MELAVPYLNELIPDPGAEFDFGELEMGPLSFTPPAGVDEARAWQIAIPIEGVSGTGLAVTLYADMVALREGDAIVLVQAFDLSRPFDPELRDQFLTTIGGRLVGSTEAANTGDRGHGHTQDLLAQPEGAAVGQPEFVARDVVTAPNAPYPGSPQATS